MAYHNDCQLLHVVVFVGTNDHKLSSRFRPAACVRESWWWVWRGGAVFVAWVF
ncbi:hypothetical protein X011_24525 [Mycobacterium tuberculosis variant microti OV254]|nr:hypothetical protein X011_24525 [Mycobacterium tuberculosis variant microti OV254]